MDFLYSFILKLAYPTSLCALLLLMAAAFRKRARWSRACFWMALGILMVCGNGWVVDLVVRRLEVQYLPSDPVPRADCILVLSGGLKAKEPPRPTIEVGEAGDRLLYAAHLYRQGHAPQIVCTGEKGKGSIVARPIAEDMAEFLNNLGVPKEAVILEKASQNTHEHAANLAPLFEEKKIKQVLLVTSALHMPRSVSVFRHDHPTITFIPAPTDFQCTVKLPRPWYHHLLAFIPTPSKLALFSEAMHEWVGLLYYKCRGWA